MPKRIFRTSSRREVEYWLRVFVEQMEDVEAKESLSWSVGRQREHTKQIDTIRTLVHELWQTSDQGLLKRIEELERQVDVFSQTKQLAEFARLEKRVDRLDVQVHAQPQPNNQHLLSYWNDLNVGGVSLTRAASSQPDLIALDSTNILVYGFDGGSSTEELHGSFELEHSYEVGTDIYPHVHWYTTTANAGDVKWQLDYWIIIGTSIIVSGALDVTTSATGTAWEEIFAEFGSISGANLNIAAQIHFRVYRNPSDGADTYPDDAALGTFGVHIKTNTRGSVSKTIK